MIPSSTDKELKELAISLHRGEIFTDRHLERKEDLSLIFSPLLFMSKEISGELVKDPPGLIYEYIDKAGPWQ
jgi:hypothetical protein